MVLNAYAILDAFLLLLRFLIGFLVLGLCAASWRQGRGMVAPSIKTALENRAYLLGLLAFWLVVLNLISWPLFYLLLQSYVPQWPGVMCIYGVLQIGSGTEGSSRFLPGLLQVLQATKPLLVFGGGAWLTFYLINRRTTTGPLRRLLLGILTVVGLLAIVDAAVEAAYLLIPKKEEFLSAGCCTEAFDGAGRGSRFLPHALFGEEFQGSLTGLYFGINAAMVLALFLWTRPSLQPISRTRLALLLTGAVFSVVVSAIFLVEIAAPRLLHLPLHHCPYDLLPQVPESMIGVGLFLLGFFGVGWAFLAGWFAGCPETQPFLNDVVRKILLLGLIGYVGSLVMMIMELWLA